MSLRSRPPKPATADAFVRAAEPSAEAPPEAARSATIGRAGEPAGAGRRAPPAARSTESELPWEAPEVRDDVRRAFNLRLPEPYKLKLDWLRARTRISQHAFVMEALLPAIDRAVEDELEEGERRGARR